MTTMRQLRCLAGVLGLALLGSGTRLQAQNEGFEDPTKQPLKIAQRLAVPRQPAGRPCAPRDKGRSSPMFARWHRYRNRLLKLSC